VTHFAIQVRFKIDNDYKYHYVINPFNFVIDNAPVDSPILPINMMFTTIQERKLDDGKNYYLLSSYFGPKNAFGELDINRIDIFDEKFNYLESNNVFFSKFLISHAKQIPFFLEKQINSVIFQMKIYNYEFDNYIDYLYPEPSDIIFFQRFLAKKRVN
jgi:hypothetical protein